MTKKCSYFIFVLLLALYSCREDDSYQRGKGNPDEKATMLFEARNFFEKYVASLSWNITPKGLYPGNFAPVWKNAVVLGNPEKDSIISINVPIVSSVSYVGNFVKNGIAIPAKENDTYSTAIGQELTVLYNVNTGVHCCYLATIIPAEESATMRHLSAVSLFNSNGYTHKFNGIVIYTTIDKNTTVLVDQYFGGSVERASMLNAANSVSENAKAISRLLNFKGARISAKALPADTKYGGGDDNLPDIGYNLDPVDIWGDDKEPWWGDDWPEDRPNPFEPPYEPPYDPSYDPPGNTDNGGSSNNNTNDDTPQQVIENNLTKVLDKLKNETVKNKVKNIITDKRITATTTTDENVVFNVTIKKRN